MKSLLSNYIAALALVAWAASAMAAQNQAIWVSDNGGGISLTPATSTNGTVLYTGSDAFWSSVIVVGVAYPPNSGLATLGSPAINVSISALSVGGANANLHPLTVTFSADGFGPTYGTFAAMLNGHMISGLGQSLTFNTYCNPANTLGTNAPAILLTSSGSLLNYSGRWTNSAISLIAPYSLSEVFTINASTSAAGYSLAADLENDLSIAAQPANQQGPVGGTATFSVVGTGDQPLGYQWLINGTNVANAGRISGAQTNNLLISNLLLSDAGSYQAVITNSYGSLTSAVAVLTVTQPAVPRIASIALLSNCQIQLQVSGDPGQYAVEASSNLADWVELSNFTTTGDNFQYLDSTTNQTERYYRVHQIP
jgi:hypothetical protein